MTTTRRGVHQEPSGTIYPTHLQSGKFSVLCLRSSSFKVLGSPPVPWRGTRLRTHKGETLCRDEDVWYSYEELTSTVGENWLMNELDLRCIDEEVTTPSERRIITKQGLIYPTVILGYISIAPCSDTQCKTRWWTPRLAVPNIL